MPNRNCSVDVCERPVKARGWCGMHYARWCKTGTLGSPGPVRFYGDVASQFLSRTTIDTESGCWLWTGARGGQGYGHMRSGGSDHRVHVLAHKLLIGPIPPGMQVDHECHNRDLSCPGGLCPHRRCWNPAHLTTATNAENHQRARHGHRRRLHYLDEDA